MVHRVLGIAGENVIQKNLVIGRSDPLHSLLTRALRLEGVVGTVVGEISRPNKYRRALRVADDLCNP